MQADDDVGKTLARVRVNERRAAKQREILERKVIRSVWSVRLRRTREAAKARNSKRAKEKRKAKISADHRLLEQIDRRA